MNKDQIEKYQERSLRKKYNMLHMLPTLSSKALSGLYYKNFHNSVKRYQITLPEQLRNGKFCSYCGSTYVPNINATLQVTNRAEQDTLRKPGNKGTEAPKKCVKVNCLNCEKSTLFEWEPSMVDLAMEQDSTIMTNSTTGRKAAPAIEKLRKGKVNSGKDRSKKRKLNSITNLLSKRNQEKKMEKKKSSLLSLESFMKN